MLLDILACPCEHHAPVEVDESASQIVCTRCRTRFPVQDGIPVMLLEEATPGPAGIGSQIVAG
jgi:uncharacterized protein YbaR (Trm112 family)